MRRVHPPLLQILFFFFLSADVERWHTEKWWNCSSHVTRIICSLGGSIRWSATPGTARSAFRSHKYCLPQICINKAILNLLRNCGKTTGRLVLILVLYRPVGVNWPSLPETTAASIWPMSSCHWCMVVGGGGLPLTEKYQQNLKK